MSDLQKEQLFLKYRGLARKIAGKFSKAYNRSYRDMADAAEYALALELFGRMKYNSQKGKLSSWLYQVIYFHMKHLCTRGVHPSPNYPGAKKAYVRDWGVGIPMSKLGDEETVLDPPARSNWVENLLREVSEEGAALLKIILDAPEDIANELGGRASRRGAQKARQAVHAYLVDELDWNPATVERAWEELAECL